MDKRQLITIILTLILGAVTAQADVIKGRVLDADTGEPLEGAEVVFIEKDTRWGDVLQTTIRTDSVGRFQRACEMEMLHIPEHTRSAFWVCSQQSEVQKRLFLMSVRP